MSEFKAFISCSLREEDSSFIQFIEDLLKSNGVIPFGTVGRHSQAAANPVESMKTKILESDFIVVCATKRYLQSDVHSGNNKETVSEMLQFESGMAHAIDKPVVVFVQDNVDVGSAIPNITQYVKVMKNINGNYSFNSS